MSFQSRSQFPQLRLKYGVDLRRARIDGAESNSPYIGLENIESGTGRFVQRADQIESDSDLGSAVGDSLCSVFQQGDVLFGKLRPYLAKAWIAAFSGRCSTEILPLEPTKFDAEFLLYLLLSKPFIDTVDQSTFGSKMPRADWDFIGNVPVPCPDEQTQRATSRFLRSATNDIDALIEAKQTLLGLLAEKRRTLVAEAVMHGLDRSAPLRPSGVDWLGDIPAHWEVRRLATLFTEKDERNEPDLPLLEVSINTGVSVRQFSTTQIEGTAADFNTYKVARKGSIAFNKMRMWQGAVGVSPTDGLISPDYVVAEPSDDVDADFAGLLFRTPAFSAECARHSQGITWDRLRLYWDGFRDISIGLPPLNEQRKIVELQEREASKIDRLASATERSIALLKERRSALIAAAVTGQIDIPEAA